MEGLVKQIHFCRFIAKALLRGYVILVYKWKTDVIGQVTPPCCDCNILYLYIARLGDICSTLSSCPDYVCVCVYIIWKRINPASHTLHLVATMQTLHVKLLYDSEENTDYNPIHLPIINSIIHIWWVTALVGIIEFQMAMELIFTYIHGHTNNEWLTLTLMCDKD